MKALLATVILGLSALPALADEAAPPPEEKVPEEKAPEPKAPAEQSLTAADVASAPRPGQEHGRVDPIDTGDGAGRIIGRGLLWIPRIPIEIVFQPVRGALYLQEKYNVADKVASVFVSEDGRVGLYPTVQVQSGFGFNIGAKAFVRDMLGAKEKLTLQASFGGRYNRQAAAEFDTGKRISKWFSAGIEGRLENRDRDRFFGYGNSSGDPRELMDGEAPMVDVQTNESISTRFRMDLARVTPRIRFNLPGHLRLQLEGGYVKKEYGVTENPPGNDVSIEQAYEISGNALPGFVRGTTFLYTEAELAYDSRRAADAYDAPGVRGTGALLMGFFGRQAGREEGEPSFYRIGVDLQRYFRITPGPRVFEVRAYGEMVTGERDEVPFTELPRLGGQDVLRGYQVDRFRDRVATVAQASYLFLIGRILAGSVFVDAGKVHSGLDDMDLKDLRVGYGLALEAYSQSGMLVRGEVASSIDGGFFFYLSFNPVFEARSRVERY